MLRVYDKNATDFNNNGLAVLNEATNVKITRELNGEFKLSFDYPVNSDKWQYLKQRNKVVCEGQQFRVYQKSRSKAGTMTRTVECLHVITDASLKHIPYLEPLIAHTPRSIMLTAFAGTDFHVMTEEEVQALGMQWVTDLTDIMEMSKTNPMEVTKQLIENLGKGELYIDNYNIALVERIGKDTGLYCTLSNNLQSLGDTEDGSNIITRLYAYGKDGLPLPPDVAPNGYIDSPEGIANFGICEGYIDYDIVEDPQELYQRALWEFSPDNPNRIDMPNLSYSVKLVELYKLYGNNFKLSLGDSIKIKDKTLGIDTTQRIVKYNYYPYSPQESEVTLGKPPKTIIEVIKSTVSASAQYKKTVKANGEIKASWLENLIKNLQQEVYNGLKKELTLHKTGDLWEFGNNTAIAIVDGVLAIANRRKEDGTWDFRTLGDGNGIIADEITAGTLKGIKIHQLSDDGKILMEVFKDAFGGVVKIFDNNGLLNAKLGSESGAGNNKGGTLVLYDNVPTGADPTNYSRVEAGIIETNGAGTIILRTPDTIGRIRMIADDGSDPNDTVPRITLLGDYSTTWLSSKGGQIANQNIATENFVLNFVINYVTQQIANHIAEYHSGT